MIKFLFFLLLIVTLGFLGGRTTEVAAQGETVAPNRKNKPSSSSGPPAAPTVQSLNAFSRVLYEQVYKGQDHNLAVSPLGSYILLALLHAGAEGETLEAIEKNLVLDSSHLQNVSTLVESLDALTSLTLAQRIYLSRETTLRSDYQSRVGSLFQEPTEHVPFRQNPEEAVQGINEWVEEKTAGLLKNFLSPLSQDTCCVLLSVLHFKGQWAKTFDPRNTVAGTFTRNDGSKLTVPMMRLTDTLAVQPTETGTLLSLRYTDETECLLFLPNPGKSPESLLSESQAAELLNSEFSERVKVKLELPRFGFETETFELTEAWAKIGLGPLVENPNLDGMLEIQNSEPLLELQVLHKTFIKVDEKGTEAAAATAVVALAGSAPSPVEPLLLRFDRPFLFLLRHSESRAIFMIGRVDQPELWSGP